MREQRKGSEREREGSPKPDYHFEIIKLANLCDHVHVCCLCVCCVWYMMWCLCSGNHIIIEYNFLVFIGVCALFSRLVLWQMCQRSPAHDANTTWQTGHCNRQYCRIDDGRARICYECDRTKRLFLMPKILILLLLDSDNG